MNTYFSHTISWSTLTKTIALVASISAIAMTSFFLVVYGQCVFTNNICPLPMFESTKNNVLGIEIKNTATDIQTLEKKREYWKQIILTHPDYEDAYVQLIILSYQLENNEEVQHYINALEIHNPNHAQLESLQKLRKK